MTTPEFIPFMAEQPVRRYTRGGRVAHLFAYGSDFGNEPYPSAFCGLWNHDWRGSGSQAEEDRAASLALCTGCLEAAQETTEFLVGLMADVNRWQSEQKSV